MDFIGPEVRPRSQRQDRRNIWRYGDDVSILLVASYVEGTILRPRLPSRSGSDVSRSKGTHFGAKLNAE
jgi:hypothetical protein